MKKVIIFILVFITPFVVHASKFHFEESADVAVNGTYYSCSLEGDKAYCLYNKDAREEKSIIQEIDLKTADVRTVKELDNSDLYSQLIKVGDKYLAPSISIVDKKMSVYVLDSNFNVTKEFPIAVGGYIDRYIVEKINGDYYIMNHAINIVSDAIAFKVSSDLETSTLVYEDDLVGEEYDIIKMYAFLHDYLNPDEFSRVVCILKEYNGGFLVQHSPEEGIYDKLLYFKDGELKWEKDYNGAFSPFFINGENFIVLNESTQPIDTKVSEYREDGSLVREYSIDNINEKERLFLTNFLIGDNNGIYYWFTYYPNSIEDFYQWGNWRITAMTLVNTITNLSKDYLSVIDYAYPGDEVTITVDKNKESSIDKIVVRDENGKEITVNNNKFTMPSSDVTVEVINKNPNTKNGNILIIVTIFICSLTLIFYKISDKSSL